MLEREPVIRTMKASRAREQFSDVLNRVFRRETRVIVEKSGIPVAAIVSAEDFKRLSDWDALRAQAFMALDATRKAFSDVPDQELERQVERAVTVLRRQHRKRQQRSVAAS